MGAFGNFLGGLAALITAVLGVYAFIHRDEPHLGFSGPPTLAAANPDAATPQTVAPPHHETQAERNHNAEITRYRK